MTELSATTRALLDAAREGLAPDPAALHRVRGKVGAAVAGGVTGGALALKLSVFVVAAALVGGALAVRDPDEVVAPVLDLANRPAAALEARATHEAPPPPSQIALPEAHVRSAIGGHPAVPPTTTAPPPPVAAPISLAREVLLVDRAMSALRTDDPVAALAAVRLHAGETRGRGQLAEDAAAIEVEALCHLHDRRVVAKLAAFDARWPESAQRSRLTTTCP